MTAPEWIRRDPDEIFQRSAALRALSDRLRAEARDLREELGRLLNETRRLGGRPDHGG